MNRSRYYFAAIAFHLLVLGFLGFHYTPASSLPVMRTYVAVTLLRDALPVQDNLKASLLNFDSLANAPPLPPTRDFALVRDSGSPAAGSQRDIDPIPAVAVAPVDLTPVSPPEPETKTSSVAPVPTLPTPGPLLPLSPVGPPVAGDNRGANSSGATTSGTGRGGEGTGQGGRGGHTEEPAVLEDAKDGTPYPFNGHYYEAVYVPEGVSWDEARAAAFARGGYLATITSAEENDFVFHLVQNPKFWLGAGIRKEGRTAGEFRLPGVFLGGSVTTSGQWLLENGEGLFEYANWADSQPPYGPRGEFRNQWRLGFYYSADSPQAVPRALWWVYDSEGYPHTGYIVEWDEKPPDK